MVDRDYRLARKLAARLPMAFRAYTGKETPSVGTDEIVFFEDRKNDVAKILMKRSNRVFVFLSVQDDDNDPVAMPGYDQITEPAAPSGLGFWHKYTATGGELYVSMQKGSTSGNVWAWFGPIFKAPA